MIPKAVPSVATPLKPLLWCLSASKAQLSLVWTALVQCPLAVDHSQPEPSVVRILTKVANGGNN